MWTSSVILVFSVSVTEAKCVPAAGEGAQVQHEPKNKQTAWRADGVVILSTEDLAKKSWLALGHTTSATGKDTPHFSSSITPKFTRNAMHSKLQFWWVQLQLAVFKESLKAGCQSISGTFAQCRGHLQGLRVVQSCVACVTDSLKVPWSNQRTRQFYTLPKCISSCEGCVKSMSLSNVQLCILRTFPNSNHSCIFIIPDQVQWCQLYT